MTMYICRPQDLTLNLLLTMTDNNQRLLCPYCFSNLTSLDENRLLHCTNCHKSSRPDLSSLSPIRQSGQLLLEAWALFKQPDKVKQAYQAFKKAAASFKKCQRLYPLEADIGRCLAQLGQAFMEQRMGEWEKAINHKPNPLRLCEKLPESTLKWLIMAAAYELDAHSLLQQKAYGQARDLFILAARAIEQAIELVEYRYISWLSEKEVQLYLQAGESASTTDYAQGAPDWYRALFERKESTGFDFALYQKLEEIPELQQLFSRAFDWKNEEIDAALARKWIAQLFKKSPMHPGMDDLEEIFLAQIELADHYLREGQSRLAQIVFESFELVLQASPFKELLQKQNQQAKERFETFVQKRKEEFERLLEKVEKQPLQEKEGLSFEGEEEGTLYELGEKLQQELEHLDQKKAKGSLLLKKARELQQIALRLLCTYPFSIYQAYYENLYWMSLYYQAQAEIELNRPKKALEHLDQAEKILDSCKEDVYQEDSKAVRLWLSSIYAKRAKAWDLLEDKQACEEALKISDFILSETKPEKSKENKEKLELKQE